MQIAFSIMFAQPLCVFSAVQFKKVFETKTAMYLGSTDDGNFKIGIQLEAEFFIQ